eukprot:PITA_25864
MNLVDIVTSNGLFTWNNKRGGESQVVSKLDRFIISEDLILIGKEMIARVLPFGGSDHWPVQLEMQGIGTPRNRPFRFDNIWLSHPDFINNIATWNSIKPLSRMALTKTKVTRFPNTNKTRRIYVNKRRYFGDHSRVQWLKEGERNTKFFHRSTIDNRAHNRISLIKDKDGNFLNSREEIEAVLVQHFSDIVKEHNSD